MLFALFALALTQTPPPAPYPEEPALVEAPPPLVQMAPAADVPPSVETPLRPEEVPPPPDAPPRAPPAPIEGLDGFATGLVQAGVGTGVAGVLQASLYVLGMFTAVPFVGVVANAISCVNCLLVPGVVAGLETSVGDAMGKRRAGAIVPVVATYAGCCLLFSVEVATMTVLLGAALGQALQSPDPNAAVAASVNSPAFAVANVVFAIVQPVIVGVTPALAYAFAAEDKKPGDPGGFGMPGIMGPNHATPLSTVPSSSGTSVMRF
jgi:hypothetical protein